VNWSQRLARISEQTGRAIAWLMLPMVAVTFLIVLLRYAFDLGWIWMQEGVTWMHAASFMLAAAYTLSHDEHVRVDIFYRKMDSRGRALVDIAGTLLLLLPMTVFLLIESFDYVLVSWSIHEGSREAGGLPYPFLQAIADLLANLARLGAPAQQSIGATDRA
jgi:TRAP-type mannitol/chloroaromatic compound transport system permease small subunit